MLSVKYQPNWNSGFEKKSVEWFLPYMGMAGS